MHFKHIRFRRDLVRTVETEEKETGKRNGITALTFSACSFNVNSIKARRDSLQQLASAGMDPIGVQESHYVAGTLPRLTGYGCLSASHPLEPRRGVACYFRSDRNQARVYTEWQGSTTWLISFGYPFGPDESNRGGTFGKNSGEAIVHLFGESHEVSNHPNGGSQHYPT